jgi:high-affinity iron transporter
MDKPANPPSDRPRAAFPLWIVAGLLAVGAVLAWAAITAAGVPDPTGTGKSKWAVILDIGVLVFREGLECILVLTAITASMTGPTAHHRKSVAAGAGIGAVATLITWFIAVKIIHDLSQSLDALQVQAWTGLLAVVVLLIVMNWFFHKLYWGGWISLHNRKKKELLAREKNDEVTAAKLYWGLGLLGFASFYREGFEVVLFLQSYNLQMGGLIVGLGALVGVVLSGIIAVATFLLHQRLPYRKMLELTGVLLGVVLLVMVGEQAQEMQLAKWIPTTNIPWLDPFLPDWMGLWFSVFPTVETLAAQGLAAALVIGSFFLAKKQGG